MHPRVTVYTDTQPLSIPAAPRRGTRGWGRDISATPRHRTRRRGRLTRVVSSTMLGGVILLILTVIVGMMLGLWRFAVIDTGSMRPTLNPGDVAVLISEPTADLRKGQIVAFHPPGEPHLTVTHRAVSIERTKHGVIIQTKGDANNARDPWRAHIVGATVWHEDFKLPKFGYLAVWSQQRLARFGLLSIIVILIVSMQLGWIWRPAPRGRFEDVSQA
jgi:signal peptidase I